MKDRVGDCQSLALLDQAGDEKPKLQLFVRWFLDHDDAGGRVELTSNGQVVLQDNCHNNDRVYGYCRAIVRILNGLGYDINLPLCLQGHVGPNRTRED